MNLIRELTLCDNVPGKTPVVAGTVSRIVVAPAKEMVAVPPNNASSVWKLGLTADVPQAPGRSPVLGTISVLFAVTGSTMHYPFGGSPGWDGETPPNGYHLSAQARPRACPCGGLTRALRTVKPSFIE